MGNEKKEDDVALEDETEIEVRNLKRLFHDRYRLTPASKVTNKLVASFSLKLIEISEGKSENLSFAPKK